MATSAPIEPGEIYDSPKGPLLVTNLEDFGIGTAPCNGNGEPLYRGWFGPTTAFRRKASIRRPTVLRRLEELYADCRSAGLDDLAGELQGILKRGGIAQPSRSPARITVEREQRAALFGADWPGAPKDLPFDRPEYEAKRAAQESAAT